MNSNANEIEFFLQQKILPKIVLFNLNLHQCKSDDKQIKIFLSNRSVLYSERRDQLLKDVGIIWIKGRREQKKFK